MKKSVSIEDLMIKNNNFKSDRARVFFTEIMEFKEISY